MKAPTVEQIRVRVLEDKKEEYRQAMKGVDKAQDRVDVLHALLTSLEKASRLVFSESRMLETLINHGIEHVNSNPKSRYNQSETLTHIDEPKDGDPAEPDDGMGGKAVG